MFKIYEENLQDFKDHKVPKPHAKAVKKTARSFGSSPTTLRNVVKEKGLFGNVRGAPYPRDTITIFEKLSVSQKDQLRTTVHNEIQKCISKEEGAIYPTTKSLHDAIMEIEGIPEWGKSTTYRILVRLGFAWLAHHEVNVGLLSENEYTVQRRKTVCSELKESAAQGYYVCYLDESYINTNYAPNRMIQDLNVNTSQQAKDQKVTTGLPRFSGKGERLIIIGAGGSDGWTHYEIILRLKNKQNSLDYKKDRIQRNSKIFFTKLVKN